MARKKSNNRKATREPNGAGSFRFNDRTFKWELTISYKDSTGTLKRKWFSGASKEECNEKRDEFLRKQCLPTDDLSLTISDILVYIYREKLEFKEIKPATMARKMYTVEIINKSSLGETPIIDITIPEINAFHKSILDYSQSTIIKVFTAMNMAFKKAVKMNLIQTNPLDDDDVRKPKSERKNKKVRAFTLGEEQAFIDELKNYKPKGGNQNYYKNQFLIELYSGMRMGEINALTINDVDLKNNRIYIDKTVTKDINYKPYIGDTTKTDEGTRVIPMNPKLRETMEKVIADYEPNPLKLLFFNKRTLGAISTSQVNCAFKRICEKFGLRDVNQHMLRHTCATRCVEAGVPTEVLMKWLGHTDISTTNIYLDVYKSFEERELEKLSEYLSKNLK